MSRDTDHGDIVEREGESSQCLLSIFPVEVWMLILDQVGAPKDLESVSNSCPLFYRMLQPRRVEFMFPRILDIMEDGFHKKARKMLSFRLVCRTWSDSIDQWYYRQSLPATDDDPQWEKYCVPFGNKYDWVQNKFLGGGSSNTSLISSFLAHFELTQENAPRRERSPFISDKLTIKIPHVYKSGPERLLTIRENAYRNLVADMHKLFRKCGEHIRICEFAFMGEYFTRRNFYDLLRSFPLLPNLTSLKITVGGKGEQLITKKELRKMAKFVASNPIKKFEKLQYLSVTNLAPFLANPLIRANSHATLLRT